MDPNDKMKTEDQYKYLMQLELETAKMRYTTFTALISISFILPGLALQAESSLVRLFGLQFTLEQLVFLLGFLFYCFAVFHYAWYHRYSHAYRKKLKDLETDLGVEIYSLRIRPKIGRMKMHFDWSLYLLGVVYATIAGSFVGWPLLSGIMAGILIVYWLLMLRTRSSPDEPLEQ